MPAESCLMRCNSTYRLRYWNLCIRNIWMSHYFRAVATVPTVYGIETFCVATSTAITVLLQQYLPFTVLKQAASTNLQAVLSSLQQYLPFTVLKHSTYLLAQLDVFRSGCNSTYRLRYWNATNNFFILFSFPSMLQQYLPFTVLKL